MAKYRKTTNDGSDGPPQKTDSIFKRWGARGVLSFTAFITVSVVGALVCYINVLDEPIGDTGIGDTTVVRQTPLGSDGTFSVELFCKDPATEVHGQDIPDSDGGVSYQLIRVADGKTESEKVTVKGGVGAGTHYWDEIDPATGQLTQRSAPAFVNAAAIKCLQDNRK